MERSSDEVIADWLHRRVTPLTRWAERHPVALDVLTALALALASLVGVAAQGRLRHPDVVVFCFALPAPLLVRHRDPRVSFGGVAVIALVQWLTSTPQLADAAVLIAMFWLMLDGELTEMAIAAAIVEAGAVMAALRWSPLQPEKVWVGITGLGVAAGGLGVSIRQRRALIASLRERAARLEFERDQEGRLAAAAERARIAREMHDIVSHNLTVMIGLADGASYALESSPDTSLSAMERVSQTGRQALGEMRRLLGVLRDEPEDGEAGSYQPQPGLDRLDELLARVEAAGIPVAIEVFGDPHTLPGSVQLTVFRVAQEALTNTLKHAGRPATARLTLRCDSDQVVLEVTDTGSPVVLRPVSEQSVLPPGGRGLRGMRERAAAYGGELDAGPLPEGGWRVSLTLTSDLAAVGRTREPR
jgi:signal transduction histidine kinase